MKIIGCLTLCLTMVSALPAHGEPFPAAGDGKDMWITVSGDGDAQAIGGADRLTVLHRRVGDRPPHRLQRVTRLQGKLAPHGAAAADARLWLIYSDLTVQSLAVDPQRTAAIRYTPPRLERSLPQAVQVRALAATRSGPWALLRVETAAAISALEPPPESETAVGVDDTSADEGVAAVFAAAALPADRLAHLDRNRWSSVPLPEDWPQLAPAWLVTVSEDDPRPALLVLPQPGMLWHYQYHDRQWRKLSYDIGVGGADGNQAALAPLSVSGQLLLAHVTAGEQAITARIAALRGQGTIPLGELTIADPPTGRWAVVSSGQAVTLVALDRREGAVWTSVGLQGQVSPVSPLIVEQMPMIRQTGRILVVAVLSAAMLLMFAVWRRDPLAVKITLPPHTSLADLPRRTIAAAIDLAPCVLLAGFIRDTDVRGVLNHWPGMTEDWHAMVPGLIAIGLYVVHAAITEMFTARTLGKAICGLRVVTADGKPPNLWQVLARNLLRSFDLIAWYVLPILMILGPYRQRLGDLITGTLVVADETPDEAEEDEPEKNDE